MAAIFQGKTFILIAATKRVGLIQALEPMPEFDQRHSPWNEGLSIPSVVVSRDLYRLACIFHASPSLGNDGFDLTADLRRQFQEAEAAHLLISIASVLRNSHDQNPNRTEFWRKQLPSDDVGELIKGIEAQTKPLPLTFREACNKIIHCTTLNYDYVHQSARVGDPLLRKIHLYGFLNDTEWKASIDIDRFIEFAEHMNA